VWFRRGRLFMVSPDSQAIACPLSGRNSTYRPVQISGAGSIVTGKGHYNDTRLAKIAPQPAKHALEGPATVGSSPNVVREVNNQPSPILL